MAIRILVLNAGSSSLKFQLYEMPSAQQLLGGVAERIGKPDAVLHWHIGNEQTKEETFSGTATDHAEALQEIMHLLLHKQITDEGEINLIVHRVVHGGTDYDKPALITSSVKEKIRELSELAPLHNPVSLRCIEVMEELYPGTKQMAVFDTAFHHQLPERAVRYAIPDEFYKEGIRVYGFHGISHEYISKQAAVLLSNTKTKLISLHLGNGSSVCAIQNGRSVDTSMGFSPVSGLVMATRSGDLDPSVIVHLARKYSLDNESMDKLLNHESGLQALCGITDFRDIEKAMQDGDNDATFACELYAYRIKKYIGAYAAAMNGMDAMIFTGGVGENAPFIRRMVCEEMDWLGIRLDEEKNRAVLSEIRSIHAEDSKVKIFVIPANEALEMMHQAFDRMA